MNLRKYLLIAALIILPFSANAQDSDQCYADTFLEQFPLSSQAISRDESQFVVNQSLAGRTECLFTPVLANCVGEGIAKLLAAAHFASQELDVDERLLARATGGLSASETLLKQLTVHSWTYTVKGGGFFSAPVISNIKMVGSGSMQPEYLEEVAKAFKGADEFCSATVENEQTLVDQFKGILQKEAASFEQERSRQQIEQDTQRKNAQLALENDCKAEAQRRNSLDNRRNQGFPSARDRDVAFRDLSIEERCSRAGISLPR